MSIKPISRPKWSKKQVTDVLKKMNVLDSVVILAVRGYYQDSMGEPGKNDRGLYDDAIFVVTPEKITAFNANTDPTKYKHGIATLAAGVWKYQKGVHPISRPGGYPALRQAQPVTVIRDGGVRGTGWYGINIHRGGYTTTSSLGCQTLFPDQWNEFKELVYAQMTKHGITTIKYVLVEQQG